MIVSATNPAWIDMGLALVAGQGLSVTASGTVEWGNGTSGPGGVSNDPSSTDAGYAADGQVQYGLVLLFRSVVSGAPPNTPAAGGVTQMAGTASPGAAHTYSPADIAAIVGAQDFPVEIYSAMNDDIFSDNSGEFEISVSVPSCDLFPQPTQSAAGQLVNNVPRVMIRVNPQ